MLIKTILFFCLFGYFHVVTPEEVDMETSPTNVKEITVSIQHNSEDTDTKNHDDPKKNLSKRTRANLVLNSKVIYPPGAKSASAFNQGILKFQQLLELPVNNTEDEMPELSDNKLEEGSHNSTEIAFEMRNSTLSDDMDMKNSTNCGNSTLHGDHEESSLKILRNKFIEDFGTSGEKILNLIDKGRNEDSNEGDNKEISHKISQNKSEEFELVEPLNNTNFMNDTDTKKGSIEILDDDMDGSFNITDGTSKNDTGYQSTYLPAERKSSDAKIVEVKPQKLEEIPLDLNLKNSAKNVDREEEKDNISLNIKRDILLGNLNPFFSNPSTTSIRNTNSIFFDDKVKKSGNLISPMNPFIINSISFDGAKPRATAPLFSRLKTAPVSSSESVKTLKSISFSEDSSSSSKLGGHSTSFGGLSTSSSSSFGGLSTSSSSSFGGHLSSSKSVKGRRPSYSRFRNKPSKPSKGTSVETVPSLHLEGGKKANSLNVAPSKSQKTSVKTVPSLLIREDEEGAKYSSKYQNKSPTAISSASFSFTPGAPRIRNQGRSKSYSKPRVHSSTSSYSKPSPSSKPSDSSGDGVEILKSVDYSLPEEVGKSLTKTGPAKFKRRAGFVAKKIPDFRMEPSITVDPLLVNFDMSRKAKDDSINPHLVNMQMKAFKRNTEKSRSFEFRPSLPDSKTRKIKEFNPDLQKPSIQFQTITEMPLDEMFEFTDYGSDDDRIDSLQNLGSFERSILFKPYFSMQSPKSFQTTRIKKRERSPRSFEVSNLNSMKEQSPKSFEMVEPHTYRYFGNVHMIDLS